MSEGERFGGTVTAVSVAVAGVQDLRLDVVGRDYDVPVMVLRWGRIAMRFTTAAQVQAVLGLFAMARQALYDGVRFAPLSEEEPCRFDVATTVSITWRRPVGTATREKRFVPTLRKVITVVDLDGADSAVAVLHRAWRTGLAVFDDADQCRDNPVTPSWAATHPRQLRRAGHGWIPA